MAIKVLKRKNWNDGFTWESVELQGGEWIGEVIWSEGGDPIGTPVQYPSSLLKWSRLRLTEVTPKVGDIWECRMLSGNTLTILKPISNYSVKIHGITYSPEIQRIHLSKLFNHWMLRSKGAVASEPKDEGYSDGFKAGHSGLRWL